VLHKNLDEDLEQNDSFWGHLLRWSYAYLFALITRISWSCQYGV